MAVVTVWKCDRDNAMFDNKKDAEEHDKMLELAANITCLIEQHIKIEEQQSEAIGLLLAKHRDKLAMACKGKPAALLQSEDKTTAVEKQSSAEASKEQSNKVTPLSANR